MQQRVKMVVGYVITASFITIFAPPSIIDMFVFVSLVVFAVLQILFEIRVAPKLKKKQVKLP